MLTKDQKEASLKVATVIAKEYAGGAGGSQSVSVVLRNVYNTINKIKVEIEESTVEQKQGPRPQQSMREGATNSDRMKL
jgi:hypothetical protein